MTLLPGCGLASVAILLLLRRLDEWIAAVIAVLIPISLATGLLTILALPISATGLISATMALPFGFAAPAVLALRSRYGCSDPADSGFRTALLPIFLTLASCAPLTLSNAPVLSEFGAASTMFLALIAVVNIVATPQLLAWLRLRRG
jgi:hypothetical protein